MQLPDNVRAAHARLSETALEFLGFVDRHPEGFDRAHFAPLEARGAMKGWAFQPWPAFGDRALVRDFERASVGLARLLKSLPARVFGNDPRQVAAFYGLESELFATLLLEEPNGIASAPLRGDFIDTPQGLKCIELNCGSNVGGWQMSSFDRFYRQVPLLAQFLAERQIRAVCRNSVRILLHHIVTTTLADAGFQGRELNVAIPFPRGGVYGFPSQPRDDFQEQYAAVLAEIGGGIHGDLAICTAADLKVRDGFIYVGDRRIHALFEQHEDRTSDQVFRAAKGRRLVLFTGAATVVLSDKRNMALLSEQGETSLFTEEEREIVRDYVPWTRLVRPIETSWRGRRASLADILLGERQDLVLKHAPSAGGMGVYVGRFTEEKQWAGIVRYALGQSDWVVQEHLPSHSFFFQCDGTRGTEHDAVWGLCVFGEAYAGCSLRLQPSSRQSIVNMSHGATTGVLWEVE
jgi:hypothetical protein